MPCLRMSAMSWSCCVRPVLLLYVLSNRVYLLALRPLENDGHAEPGVEYAAARPEAEQAGTDAIFRGFSTAIGGVLEQFKAYNFPAAGEPRVTPATSARPASAATTPVVYTIVEPEAAASPSPLAHASSAGSRAGRRAADAVALHPGEVVASKDEGHVGHDEDAKQTAKEKSDEGEIELPPGEDAAELEEAFSEAGEDKSSNVKKAVDLKEKVAIELEKEEASYAKEAFSNLQEEESEKATGGKSTTQSKKKKKKRAKRSGASELELDEAESTKSAEGGEGHLSSPNSEIVEKPALEPEPEEPRDPEDVVEEEMEKQDAIEGCTFESLVEKYGPGHDHYCFEDEKSDARNLQRQKKAVASGPSSGFELLRAVQRNLYYEAVDDVRDMIEFYGEHGIITTGAERERLEEEFEKNKSKKEGKGNSSHHHEHAHGHHQHHHVEHKKGSGFGFIEVDAKIAPTSLLEISSSQKRSSIEEEGEEGLLSSLLDIHDLDVVAIQEAKHIWHRCRACVDQGYVYQAGQCDSSGECKESQAQCYTSKAECHQGHLLSKGMREKRLAEFRHGLNMVCFTVLCMAFALPLLGGVCACGMDYSCGNVNRQTGGGPLALCYIYVCGIISNNWPVAMMYFVGAMMWFVWYLLFLCKTWSVDVAET
eukprot:TRINITY_DN45949_c0_g1_i1.p1 TRINITY_DN45949_c0_g1~~TRINITY_DN45949_c0_g1_i1.p1  ORF type:complete len:651 (-),score=127.36 TRINITY_DN45949_c0_g1_i1:85-2037(-)